MPTPSSGPISFSDIAWIVYRSYTAEISLNDTNVRFLIGVTTPQSQIDMNSARGKPVAGSTSYTTPGTYTFLCPAYQDISIDVRGAGGGGGSGGYQFFSIIGRGGPGAAGADSSFGGVIFGYGGGGGGGGNGAFEPPGAPGTPGGGAGGTVTVGGGSSGGAGGAGNGGTPAGSGGSGGRTTQAYTFASTAGHPVWGTNYTVVVGAGGAGQPTNPGINPGGSNGTNGAVYISWS